MASEARNGSKTAKHSESLQRSKKNCKSIINFLIIRSIDWLEKCKCGEVEVPSYLPMLMPASSSLSVIPTLRDGQLVNLPVVLLVEDDVIVVPARVKTPVRISGQSGTFERGDLIDEDEDLDENIKEVGVEHCNVKSWKRFRVEENAIEAILR